MIYNFNFSNTIKDTYLRCKYIEKMIAHTYTFPSNAICLCKSASSNIVEYIYIHEMVVYRVRTYPYESITLVHLKPVRK